MEDNEDNVATNQYVLSMKKALNYFLQEDDRITQQNTIIVLCISNGVTTSRSLLSIEATMLFCSLLCFFSMNYNGGSVQGKSGNIDCNREAAFHWLLEDYFSENPTYTPEKF